MKLHTNTGFDKHRITGYGTGYLCVNEKKFTHSLVLTPETVLFPWPPVSWQDLTVDHLISVLELKPEIVLLGTGPKQCFPPHQLLVPFAQHHIGVEIMSTPAACRTFNILMAEGRTVAAALILVSDTLE